MSSLPTAAAAVSSAPKSNDVRARVTQLLAEAKRQTQSQPSAGAAASSSSSLPPNVSRQTTSSRSSTQQRPAKRSAAASVPSSTRTAKRRRGPLGAMMNATKSRSTGTTTEGAPDTGTDGAAASIPDTIADFIASLIPQTLFPTAWVRFWISSTITTTFSSRDVFLAVVRNMLAWLESVILYLSNIAYSIVAGTDVTTHIDKLQALLPIPVNLIIDTIKDLNWTQWLQKLSQYQFGGVLDLLTFPFRLVYNLIANTQSTFYDAIMELLRFIQPKPNDYDDDVESDGSSILSTIGALLGIVGAIVSIIFGIPLSAISILLPWTKMPATTESGEISLSGFTAMVVTLIQLILQPIYSLQKGINNFLDAIRDYLYPDDEYDTTPRSRNTTTTKDTTSTSSPIPGMLELLFFIAETGKHITSFNTTTTTTNPLVENILKPMLKLIDDTYATYLRLLSDVRHITFVRAFITTIFGKSYWTALQAQTDALIADPEHPPSLLGGLERLFTDSAQEWNTALNTMFASIADFMRSVFEEDSDFSIIGLIMSLTATYKDQYALFDIINTKMNELQVMLEASIYDGNAIRDIVDFIISVFDGKTITDIKAMLVVLMQQTLIPAADANASVPPNTTEEEENTTAPVEDA